MENFDAVIIGQGPAAVSASLYLQRAGLSSCLVGMGLGSLAKAEKIENYYGFPAPVTGEALFENGLRQARALGAETVTDEVLGVDWADGRFTLRGKAGSYTGAAALLATGAARVAPNIPGLKLLEGHGVSYCAVCDGFFYRGKAVGVLGAGSYALHEAEELLPLAATVTLLTNGEAAPENLPQNLLVDTRPIARLEGLPTLEQVAFAQGEALPLSGIFVAMGTASAADLARTIGIAADGRYIAVNEDMETSFPGIFAAGDCVGGLMQVAKAVGDGARAGTAMVKYLRAAKKTATAAD